MNLCDILNEKYTNIQKFSDEYSSGSPFPHIVMENFIKPSILKSVLQEFPDRKVIEAYLTDREIKLASKGTRVFSPAAAYLNSYLQSDLMLNWLAELTQIKEPLISDPYLAGGGYHETQSGGYLKVHADFNRHPEHLLDRRLNLLIYLNEGWLRSWGGELGLYDEKIVCRKKIVPTFNTAIIFSTTSDSFHGFPDPITCPPEHSRKSLAYYYYSSSHPKSENSHSTLWMNRPGERLSRDDMGRSWIQDLTPPIILRCLKKALAK